MDVGELKKALTKFDDSRPVRFFDRDKAGDYWPSFNIEEVECHVDSDGVILCRLSSLPGTLPRES